MTPWIMDDHSSDRLTLARRFHEPREKSVLSSESFIKLAMIQLMVHRLHPDDTDAEFHYRAVA
jgi:hypothetical protein